MSIVSPFHDMCVAGCLASAALSVSAKLEAADPAEAVEFAPCALHADAPAPQSAPSPARWRRIIDALVNLVSGPTMPHGDAKRA
jgi:hypothetical protein